MKKRFAIILVAGLLFHGTGFARFEDFTGFDGLPGSSSAAVQAQPGDISLESASAPVQVQPDNIVLEPSSAPITSAQLTRSSDLIVHGTFNEPPKAFPTNIQLHAGRLVHYVQPFQVLDTIKGSASRQIEVFTQGIEPLPKPSDPLNKLYSGPIAEGEYVLFLKKIKDSPYYSIAGVWQGLYPVLGGRTVALEESGLPELGGLTVQELKQKLAASRE